MDILRRMRPVEPELWHLKFFFYGEEEEEPVMLMMDNPQAFQSGGSYSGMSAGTLQYNRSRIVKETSVTAKLPEPVAIKTKFTVMEQPARNIVDPTLPSINDLDVADQEHALGKDPTEVFKIKELSFIKKIRETQETQPYIREIPKYSDKQLKSLLERL